MTAFRYLPNLSALRAFEAAARYESFSQAADEIHLTHGAVSHQVRRLEATLGVALFTRHGKRLTITPAGQDFARAIARALGDISAAAQAVQSKSAHNRLTISSIPSFASRWLAPRLGSFIEQHPDVEVTLQSSGQLQDLTRDGVDVGIRFGSGKYPTLQVDYLMGEVYYPVVSPRFNGGVFLNDLQALQHMPLLRSIEPWKPWFEAAALAIEEPSGGVCYEDMSMLLRAAADGEGVALVRHAVALEEVRRGNLVRLFEVVATSPSSYYLACSAAALEKPATQAFRTWLLQEVAQFVTRDGWGTGVWTTPLAPAVPPTPPAQ